MISVIVPVYKVEPYLRACIDSILAQTCTDFELILVDDGSPDNCGAICDEYAQKDPRVRVIHQENGGLSAARNAGIDIAVGEYLAFIDSDDMVRSTYLESLLGQLLAEKADISVCGMEMFSQESELTPEAPAADTAAEVMTGREACASIYTPYDKIYIAAWGKLYRSTLFANIRYPVGRLHEDTVITPIVFYSAERVSYINSPLYLYRQRDDSIMGNFSLRRFDGVLSTDECIRFFTQKRDDELVCLATAYKIRFHSGTIVFAHQHHMQKQIPAEYRMSLSRALRNLRHYATDDSYTWYLSLVYPALVRPHCYLRKIKQILHIK